MTIRRVGMAAVLVLLAAACGDDESVATEAGAGGESAATTGTEATGTATSAATSTAASGDSTTTAGTGGEGGEGGAAGGTGGGGGTGGEAPSCFGTETDDPLFAQAMDVLREAIADQNVPGAAIAVLRDGELVDLGVTGSKSRFECDPITPDTLFLLGFASQLLTSVAVLDAVEEGLLELDAPITDVIPTLEASNGGTDAITLHHLLTRSSNFRTTSDKLDIPIQLGVCEADIASAFENPAGARIEAPPGTMQDSSDLSGSELAALALENVDGRTFIEAVEARVLTPLAMGGGYETDLIEAEDHALGHHPEGLPEEVNGDCRNHDPSLGYHGSIRDMAKLVAYLTGGEGDILDPATRETMLSGQSVHFFSDSQATYGANVYLNSAGDPGVWTTGYAMGFSQLITTFREPNIAVVTLMNAAEGVNPWVVNDAVVQIYAPSIPPPPPAEYEPVPASLRSLVGTYLDEVGYEGSGPRTVEVFVDPDGNLAGTLTADGSTDPVTLDGFYAADNFLAAAGTSVNAVRFWRDELTGNGAAIQIAGDRGPPLFRVP